MAQNSDQITKRRRLPPDRPGSKRGSAEGSKHSSTEARLAQQLKEALQRQAAMAHILAAINNSPGDLKSAFDVILEKAIELCEANFGTFFLCRSNGFWVVADRNLPPAFADEIRNTIFLYEENTGVRHLVNSKSPLHIRDLVADPIYVAREPLRKAAISLGNVCSLVSVPLLKQGQVIGFFAIYRDRPGGFAEGQVTLVNTFADQAVIAIENARLIDEVKSRTRELVESLDHLRATQDRLIQTEKLASLGQLTAGIAHEIKNPLNFVNNFSALSVELLDELGDFLRQLAIGDEVRFELDDLTTLIKQNLGKVVHHGKRADSIVRNMLLHSREGSGERHASDLNALVRESLNLAYHGARAERADFNITMEQDFDPNVGTIEVYPQELTRALLNLISNGFYAAVKRKMEAERNSFQPLLSAVTKNTGKAVEVRIRDNGSGIPADIREKIFNPFFTTKPTGEGTGLGLSMAYDIIVKQHGGRLELATESGAFTEFIITLPRGNDSAA